MTQNEEGFLADDLLDDVDFGAEEAAPTIPHATLRTAGGAVVLPFALDEEGNVVPQTITEAVLAADLTVPQGVQYWLEGQQVPGDTNIAPGMIITGVGNIKGG